MRFKDDNEGDSGPKVGGSGLPTEMPYAVVLEDLEHAYSHMYVVTRDSIYRFDPVTFMTLIKRYAEVTVKNDAENAPDLEKVRQATAALLGLMNRA